MTDSIRNSNIVWQSENEIVVPVPVEETSTEKSAPVAREVRQALRATQEAPRVRAHYGVPKLLAYPYVETPAATETLAAEADSVAMTLLEDSVATDTIVNIPGETLSGLVMSDPAKAYSEQPAPESGHHFPKWTGGGMSWIYLVLVVLFCAIGIKFKGNSKYMKALYADLVDTRLRNNLFDDTVKETSLLVLLNILWACCAGVMLWVLVKLTGHIGTGTEIMLAAESAKGMGICAGIAAAYLVLMLLAYLAVGNIFSDAKKTKIWVKGAVASTGLETFILFPTALLAMIYPAWGNTLLFIAAGAFIFGKTVFLYKGFRIFFAEISSWLLFLYYLCSLEIVPLILTYFAALEACRSAL